MVYQPIQRNLAFAAEFSGGTARVNGVPPPNISDQARSGQIVKETVFNLFWNLECPDSGRQREAVSFGRLVVCWNLQVSDFQTEGSRGGGSVWTCRFTPWKTPFRRQQESVKTPLTWRVFITGEISTCAPRNDRAVLGRAAYRVVKTAEQRGSGARLASTSQLLVLRFCQLFLHACAIKRFRITMDMIQPGLQGFGGMKRIAHLPPKSLAWKTLMDSTEEASYWTVC